MADDFLRPKGVAPSGEPAGLPGPGNPMPPMDGRRKREIRMWTLGDGQRGTTKEKLRLAYLAFSRRCRSD